MPHAGLMDENALGPLKGPLQRARLHLRGGKRRLAQGKISAGIVTLYDAVEAAMESYTAVAEHRAALKVKAGENINESKKHYTALVRAGVLDGTFDFVEFDRLTERALNEELPDFDYRPLLASVERVLRELEILPFNEGLLPPEDPKTY